MNAYVKSLECLKYEFYIGKSAFHDESILNSLECLKYEFYIGISAFHDESIWTA